MLQKILHEFAANNVVTSVQDVGGWGTEISLEHSALQCLA